MRELKENRQSDIGSGIADIYRGTFLDSLAYFKGETEVYVAKDERDGAKSSLRGKPTVLVTNPYKGTLRAYPFVEGELKMHGMASGSFIYTPNDVVMNGYMDPIRLLDRFEGNL